MKHIKSIVIFLLVLVPAYAHASVVYDNQTGFTINTTPNSGVAGMALTSFVPLYSGVLTNVVEPLTVLGSGNLSNTGAMKLYLGAYTGQAALDCSTALKTFTAWGVTDVSADPGIGSPLINFNGFTGTQCQLTPAVTYSLHSPTQSSNTVSNMTNQNSNPYIQVYTNNSYISVNTTTRIDTVSPYSGQTGVSSTSPITLYADGYINQIYTGDLSGGQAVDHANKNGLQIKWRLQNAVNSLTSNTCVGTGLQCPFGFNDYLSGTGYTVFPTNTFSVSTTTIGNLSTGYYTLTTSIIKRSSFFGLTGLFGFNFGYDTIVSTSTTFSAGTVTTQQTQLFNLTQANAGGVSAMTSTTTAASLSSCNPLSLNLGLCLAVLFYPTQSDMQALLQFAHDNFLNRAPWGYATRMVSILTNNATTTANTALPTWVVTFPSIQGASGSPLAGSSISFDMQNMLDTGSTTLNGIVDPISGKNMRTIIEPYILLFIAISALIIVFHDIMGMGKMTNTKYADK